MKRRRFHIDSNSREIITFYCTLIGTLALIFFGYMQVGINRTLTKIETYRYNQEKEIENVRNIENKKRLDKLFYDIIEFYTFDINTPNEVEFNNRTSFDKILLSEKIIKLLDKEYTNHLIINNNFALYKFLDAYSKAKAINSFKDYYTPHLDENINLNFDGIFTNILAIRDSLNVSYWQIKDELK